MYDYYQGGSSQYTGAMPGYGQDPGYYYSGGMGSYGPQAGPSTSARYDYENPFTREISQINTRLSELYQQQQQMNQDMAHNMDLTQQNWAMATSMHYDISNIFQHLDLDPNKQNPNQSNY